MECVAGRSLQRTDIDRLAVLAFLHDIGKANAGFQVRYWADKARRPRYWLAPECGHGPQGWALFDGGLHEAARVLAGLPLEPMDNWGEAVSSLLHASISHHGRPVVAETTEIVWQPVRNNDQVVYDPAVTVAALGRRVQEL